MSASNHFNQINHYQILKLSQNATIYQIKKAFKLQIKRYHPDKNFTNQNDIQNTKKTDFKKESMKIIQAYQCLSNPIIKQKYDQQLKLKNKINQIVQCRYTQNVEIEQENKTNKNSFSRQKEEQTAQQKQEEESYNQFDYYVLVCQQCLGERQIAVQKQKDKQLQQICVNCQTCGMFMMFS